MEIDNNERTIGNEVNSQCTTEGSNSQPAAQRPVRHHRRDASNDKYFRIRNILNIIFIIGAIVGMGIFYFHDRTMGTIVILTAMAFKIAECCFRFIRQ